MLRILTYLSLVLTAPALGQTRDRGTGVDFEQEDVVPAPQPTPAAVPLQGRLGDAGNGQIGQRQTRADAAPLVSPLGRVQGRIANRVQNRLRNRIDRFYDPQANATTPFRVAGDQARAASTPRQ